MLRVDQQVVQLPRQRRQRARHRQLAPLHADQPAGVQLHQPDGLLLARLGERVRHRAARVPQPLGEHLRPVQVAEGHVVHTVEHVRGHVLHAADGDGPLRVAARPAGHERVRQHHRPGARAPVEVRADPAHRLGQHTGVPAGVRHLQRLPRGFGLQERDAVERHRPVRVRQQHRLVQLADPGAQVQPARGGERAEHADPRRRVVVARRDHDPRARRADPGQHPRAGVHGLRARHRPVVQVARDDHHVHPLGRDQVGQAPEHRLLLGQQVPAVERAAHVPVRGVQQTHGATL